MYKFVRHVYDRAAHGAGWRSPAAAARLGIHKYLFFSVLIIFVCFNIILNGGKHFKNAVVEAV